MCMSPIFSRWPLIMAFTSLALATDAHGFSGPSNPQVTAVASATAGRIEVSWPDFDGESGYRVFETAMSDPPPLMTGASMNTGWSQIQSVASDITSVSVVALGARRFIVCAFAERVESDLISQCFGPSISVTPAAVLDEASINGLTAVEVRSTSITVTWRDSYSTVRSEISVNPGGQRVVDDADERHRFTGLTPGTTFTITGCAQSESQLEAGTRTCSQITVATLPAAPTSVDSLTVLPSMDPRSRTIRFTDDNPASHAASSYSVRLFAHGGDTVLRERQVLGGAGQVSRDVRFDDLEPFKDYEVWVIPLNISGVGSSAGIGFTTPAEVVPRSTPLSGTSALLEFETSAVGEYTVERQATGGTTVALTRVLVTTPGKQRFVIANMTGTQRVRVRWRFATLESESDFISVRRGRVGAPEVLSGIAGPLIIFGVPLPSRISAEFTPTVNDAPSADVSYILRGELVGGGFRTMAELPSPPFAVGDRLSISATSQILLVKPRVCRRTAIRTACSAVVNLGTEGVQRVY